MTEIPGFSEEIDMSHPANRGDDDLPIGPEHTVTDINGVPRRGWEIAAVEDSLRIESARLFFDLMWERQEADRLRTELMAARDALAKFTAANVAHAEAEPDPIANAIRPREMDRRRVGWC